MENKEKSIGYIVLTILELFLVFCYILTVQFGWNQILTTIVPVNTLSLVQTFGLALVTELLFKGISKPKTDTEKHKIFGLIHNAQNNKFENMHIDTIVLDEYDNVLQNDKE